MTNDWEQLETVLQKADWHELSKEMPNFFDDTYISGAAYLNWRIHPHQDIETQFFNLAEGYFEVAISLIKQCIENNESRRADIWIFPILFNIVHGIELYLKGFNSLYTKYMALNEESELIDSKIEGTHDILQLCETALSKIKQDEEKEFFNELKFVKKFIKHIYDNTEDMAFARYPINKKKDKQFYVSNQNVVINLNYLLCWVIKVKDILETICFALDCSTSELRESYEYSQDCVDI